MVELPIKSCAAAGFFYATSKKYRETKAII
jgi:hypothetical protein